MKFTLDQTINEAVERIAGVLQAVTLRDRQFDKTCSFVVVDEDKMQFDKSAIIGKARKSEKIWELVWDSVYAKTNLEENQDDFDSWVSAFDGKPMPLSEMIECRNHVVGRIKELNPRALLEIGCGTGLLLWKLHDAVESYFGIDPSEQAIDKLAHALKARRIGNVQLARGTAAHLEQYLHRRFDTVVMNSVSQYFPGTEYLKSVIVSVLGAACNSLFIGDIKSLRHWSVFQASVALHQAIGGEPANGCLKGGDRLQANELSVSEDFLEMLAGDAYALELQLKREGHFNEMSRYRYDAIFHQTKQPAIVEPDISLDFTSMEDVARLIGAHPSSTIEILNIPNSRLVADVWAFENASEFDGTVEELLNIAETKKSGAVDPGELYELGDNFSVATRVIFSRGNLSLINALFEPHRERIGSWMPEKGMAHPYFTNDPAGKASRAKIAQYLKDELARMNVRVGPYQVIVIHQLPRRGGSLDVDRLVDLIPAG